MTTKEMLEDIVSTAKYYLKECTEDFSERYQAEEADITEKCYAIEKELDLKECYEKNQIPYLQEICRNYSDLLRKLKERKEEEIRMIDELLKKYE